jgi:hypothetical protein
MLAVCFPSPFSFPFPFPLRHNVVQLLTNKIAITNYLLDLEAWIASKGPTPDGVPFSLVTLQDAVLQFQSDAKEFEEWEEEWERVVYSSGGFESASMEAHRMSHNTRMADFETHLLDLEEGGGVSSCLSCLFLGTSC